MKNYYTHNRNYEKFDRFVEILFMFSIIFFTISVTFVNTLLLIYKPIEIEDVFLNEVQQMSYTENVTSNAVPAISVKEIIEQQENSNDIVEEETIPYEEYIIQRGDNLWNISRKYYGDGNYYTWIEKCNDLYGNNRNLIKGQVLKIYPLYYNITIEEIEQIIHDK